MTLDESKLVGGFQDGVKIANVHNGGNLEATVLIDRCMDLYQVRYKGVNMNYISPAGIISPQYYNVENKEWLRGFFVGQLTTCGLQNIGNPFINDNLPLGMHGRISFAPAENYCSQRIFNQNDNSIILTGHMREATLFGENLLLNRRYEFNYKNDEILITDTISNNSSTDTKFMYLLHLNFGYPFLSDKCEISVRSKNVVPRDEHAKDNMDNYDTIPLPSKNFVECCYFHEMEADQEGLTGYCIYNNELDIGVEVEYRLEDLPYFCQWNMFGYNEYVIGLEPMNSFLDGPKIQDDVDNKIPTIEGYGSRKHEIKLRYFSGRSNYEKIRNQ